MCFCLTVGPHLCVGGGRGLLVHVCAKYVCVCVCVHPCFEAKIACQLELHMYVCRQTPVVGSVTAQLKTSSLTATRLLCMTVRC